MTFRDALAGARISQSQLIRLVFALTGENVSPTTTSRWYKNDKASPWAIAFLIVLARLSPEAVNSIVPNREDMER